MQIDGTIGARDLREGISLCERAASAGAVEAQLYLARNYLSGEVFGPDRQRALYWYERAARADNAEALYWYGMLRQEGLRTGDARQDILYALERAAEQGYQAAYLPTAEMYNSAPTDPATSLPTADNLAKSYLWLQATLRASNGPDERSRAQNKLESVMEIMPQTWLGDLDQSVDEHFEKLAGGASH